MNIQRRLPERRRGTIELDEGIIAPEGIAGTRFSNRVIRILDHVHLGSSHAAVDRIRYRKGKQAVENHHRHQRVRHRVDASRPAQVYWNGDGGPLWEEAVASSVTDKWLQSRIPGGAMLATGLALSFNTSAVSDLVQPLTELVTVRV